MVVMLDSPLTGATVLLDRRIGLGLHEPARYAPIASPTPADAIIRPRPKLPAENESVARKGSPTLTNAFANIPTFQAINTVSSARERRTSIRPSARSRQWPRDSARACWSSRRGIWASRAAERRKVAALIQ